MHLPSYEGSVTNFKYTTMNKVMIPQDVWCERLQSEIDKSNGRFFSVTFIKKDGTTRKMVCRTGVTKGLQGGELKYDARARKNAIVWDTKVKGYRTIPLKRLIDMRINGTEFTNTLLPF